MALTRLNIDVDALLEAHKRWTVEWHRETAESHTEIPWTFFERNHRMNFELWHEEDKARRDDLGPEPVRMAKRNIDRCNQARNDAIETIDQWLLQQLPGLNPASPLHSETPGMIIDRLSILALKLYHMRLEALRDSATPEQRSACEKKCGTLSEQLQDLASCLRQLMADLQSGARRFKVYRQLKMYNNPDLNPELYRKRS
jgi:hypothetical protein